MRSGPTWSQAMPAPFRVARWTSELAPEACMERLAEHATPRPGYPQPGLNLAPGSREISFRLYLGACRRRFEGRHCFHGALLTHGSGAHIVGRVVPDPFALSAVVLMCWLTALVVVAIAMLDDRTTQIFRTCWLASPRGVLPLAAGVRRSVRLTQAEACGLHSGASSTEASAGPGPTVLERSLPGRPLRFPAAARAGRCGCRRGLSTPGACRD